MTKSIILASGSIIRQNLLTNACVPFTTEVARIDEEAIRASLQAVGTSPHDIADALAEAKARGVKLGGMRDKTMQRNKAVQANAKLRAEKVSGIIRPLRDAGKSLRDIAEELNKAGVQTARGGVWQASQVKRTLERLAS